MAMMKKRTAMILRKTILMGMMLKVMMTLMDMTRGNEEMYILPKKTMTSQR